MPSFSAVVFIALGLLFETAIAARLGRSTAAILPPQLSTSSTIILRDSINTTLHGNETDFEFCFLPAGLLEYPETIETCPSSSSMLISLMLFNAFSGAINLFLGHDATRRAIKEITPSFLARFRSKSDDWEPYAAFCMTCLQIFGMVLSTAIARSNGFTAPFGFLFGMWSLRPRMALLTFLYDAWYIIRRQKTRSFRYTLRDTILSESLLNLFSIVFALNLLQSTAQDELGCQSNYDSTGGQPNWVVPMKAALGWKIFGGVASGFVLAVQFILHLLRGQNRKHRNRKPSGSRRRNQKETSTDRDESLDIERHYIILVSGFITFVNFITSWEIWGVFVNAAGINYCPGSVAGTGVVWGVVLAINALLRPLLGGGAVSL